MNISGSRIYLLPAVALFGCITVAACNKASTSSDSTKASGPSTVTASDIKFFTKAAQIGMTEVEAAKLASEHGADANTKAFASTMSADHVSNNTALQALAEKKNVRLPTTLNKDHRDMLDELGEKNAADFDATYADAMIGGHEAAIDLFEHTASNSKDPDISQFATSTLPTLKHHLEMAQTLKAAGQ